MTAAWSFVDGTWVEGNPQILGPMSHAFWLASTVFDGARAFEGTTPDLDLHCQRVNRSAEAMGLKALHQAGEIEEMIQDGLKKFDKSAELYIKPLYWAEGGFVAADPATTRFCLSLYESALPDVSQGMSVTLSRFRRPNLEVAPTDAKAACLYPNSGRALREAIEQGFDNAVMLDMAGNVAELCTSNIWMAKDGKAYTPVPNGSFLNGITRQRVAQLLRDSGQEVIECTLSYKDFQDADEIFNTGNYGKVMPITRIDDRELQPGPVYNRARELYWEYAHKG
ncbi:branched-chain amino acid aminotransferase [Rhodovibrionaceae bacterium A322]